MYNQINSNITEPDYVKGRAGMGYKKIKNRIIFVRHGETESNKILMDSMTINDKNLDTNLTKLGYEQAKQVADFFEKINFIPNKIIVSKLNRTYNTALPTLNYLDGKKLTNNYEFDLEFSEGWIEYNYTKNEIIKGINNLDDWEYLQESEDKFIHRVSGEFEKIKKLGSLENPVQILVFTHSLVISTILKNCIGNKSIESDVFFHLSNCSITCLDITEDDSIHIHTVNYTGHLTIPSGHHMPFI